MSNPRRPSYAQLTRTVAELVREKKISDRLAMVAQHETPALRARLAELEAPKPAPMVVLKKFGAHITVECARRAIVRGEVIGRKKIGGKWHADPTSLMDYVHGQHRG
jgi:hypothetical protein